MLISVDFPSVNIAITDSLKLQCVVKSTDATEDEDRWSISVGTWLHTRAQMKR